MFVWLERAVIYIESVRDSVIQMLITLSLPVLSVTIFIMVQKAAIRWYYLSSKVGDETGGTDGHFYTPHFNSFSHYEYFMTFISTMRGFISYLWSRLLTPLGFLFFFSTRLDRCGVVQGWESMDEVCFLFLFFFFFFFLNKEFFSTGLLFLPRHLARRSSL